ncbi:anti-Muellerian hormone type-2 receptor-like, partial [Pezoporus wallicus]|uniref:anti-Muellerian hormone type-2 receptor-like n=1 Tax=Pezoporus wallicus TaxID=35540 RepID=UPI00254B1DA1
MLGGHPMGLPRGRFPSLWPGSARHLPVSGERSGPALPLAGPRNPARLRGGNLEMEPRPAGSLRHFLAHPVGPGPGIVRLALSLPRGLAPLHRELRRPGLSKPSVVQRDQNALLRDRGTCAIGDLGPALPLPPRVLGGAAAPRGGPIRKVGTQRYLAPEILDESPDLRAWGRALLQADVYALALLLWEILSRCQALSPGAPVPAFRLAYEAELGSSPTGPQLRRLAADERRRPLIPPAWHRTPQPGGALPELLEDCGDPDPEARLSAERGL